MTIVRDYRGRQLTLLARVARKTKGHRYVTRASVRAVVLGQATHTKPSHNCGTQARKGWPARAANTRVKIGCHVFTGEDAWRLIEWALEIPWTSSGDYEPCARCNHNRSHHRGPGDCRSGRDDATVCPCPGFARRKLVAGHE